MEQLAAESPQYAAADPFPHAVIDDFFPPAVLEAVLDEFPAPDAIAWKRFESGRERKLANYDEALMGLTTRTLIHELNSARFLRWLTQLTGVENLIPDPYLEGGGHHQILPGGKLGVHADFNKHRVLGLERRLNVLVYLNQDWSEEFGGHLELWDQEMVACRRRVLPVFNRLVVFTTTSTTFHGHPDPLTCPEGRSRKSLALYYYTVGTPELALGEGRQPTWFRERPGEQFAADRQPLLRRLLPPILFDWVRRLRGSDPRR